MTAIKVLSFDTEFRDANEEFQTPVCGVVRVEDVEHRYWFLDPEEVVRFKADWDSWMAEMRCIISYVASAETRTLLALGYTQRQILSWKWLDPYVFWRMLTHSHPDFMWGTRFYSFNGTRIMIASERPPDGELEEDDWEESEGGSPHKIYAKEKYKRIKGGLADAVAHRFGIDLNHEHKENMIEMILTNTTYSSLQKDKILNYCAGDVEYLLPLMKDLLSVVRRETDGKVGFDQFEGLSNYMACIGIVENNGIPLLLDKAKNLAKRIPFVEDTLINESVKSYPFFSKQKITAADKRKGLVGTYKWVEKKEAFTNYIHSLGLVEIWPRTEAGAFKRDERTLKDFGGNEVLAGLRTAKKSKSNLRYFGPERWRKMASNIGQDIHIRPGLMPFGTVTSRHTPQPTKGYLLAMSTWLRTLIGSEDLEIISADYSAEEMMLQGWISGDENLTQACKSGDPYVWLAQYCGVLDPSYRKTEAGYVDGAGVMLPQGRQLSCKATRNTFKALLLGMAYGMGVSKLAAKLTQSRVDALPEEEQMILSHARTDADPELQTRAQAILKQVSVVTGVGDTEDYPTASKATTYRDYHRTAFAVYWSWRKAHLAEYRERGFAYTPDGWCIFSGVNDQTACNFPIQGCGQAILRRAIQRCLWAGLRIISPLHDAIYLESDPENAERDKAVLCREMIQAVEDVCDLPLLAVDAKVMRTDWSEFTSSWTAEKQAKEFRSLGHYMVG